jgi:hypothetical protein
MAKFGFAGWTELKNMNIRPFGWFIIILNLYFLFNYFQTYDSTASDTVNGFAFMFLMFWLAIMNTVLYVIYRVTGGKRRFCPVCAKPVARGLTVCPSCNHDFKIVPPNTN